MKISLAFLNMSEDISFSITQFFDAGIATLGVDMFFSLLVLSMVGIGYYHLRDEYGARNIAIIPVMVIISMTIFSVMVPIGTSILLWVLGIFLAGGSILWKGVFKHRGEH